MKVTTVMLWFAWLGVFCLTLFIFPYALYPASLALFRPRPVLRGGEGGPQRLSLLFAAYNEEQALPAKIANLRALKIVDPSLQLIAYCDRSTDRSLALLREASDLIEVIAADARTGKATGMARMVARASGDICVFTDANVILDPAALAALRGYFADPAVGGVAGSLHYTNDAESPTARAGGLYWRLEEAIKARESRCGSMMGADGSIFAVRRELYPHVPPHLLDDMIVSMAVPLAGKRLVFAPDVIALERNATAASDEFRRKRRIACRAFNTHRYLWPRLRASFGPADLYKYAAHKLLRWFGFPIGLVGVLALVVALVLVQAWAPLMMLAGLGLTGFVLGLANIAPFGVLLQMMVAIFATFLGVVDGFRGRTYQTWAPAKSRD